MGARTAIAFFPEIDIVIDFRSFLSIINKYNFHFFNSAYTIGTFLEEYSYIELESIKNISMEEIIHNLEKKESYLIKFSDENIVIDIELIAHGFNPCIKIIFLTRNYYKLTKDQKKFYTNFINESFSISNCLYLFFVDEMVLNIEEFFLKFEDKRILERYDQKGKDIYCFIECIGIKKEIQEKNPIILEEGNLVKKYETNEAFFYNIV